MSVSENALMRLRQALDAGEFAPGARLPAERRLAKRLGVGRSSLRIALAQLESEGRIWRHVGQGTFVTEAPSSEAVARRLRFDSGPSPAEVLELRHVLEPPAAAMAALRATSDDLARLGRLVEQGFGVADWREWEHVDGAFHAALASAGHNPLLVGVLEILHSVRGSKERCTYRTYAESHGALVESVSRRDPVAAASAMRAHLREVHRALVGDPGDSTAFGVAGENPR